MFTVALIGPDGAGKTTVARRLEQSLPLRVKYLYMGVNPEASNYALPTTRLLGTTPLHLAARMGDGKTAPASALGRKLAKLRSRARSVVVYANRTADEWYRQLVAAHYRRRGCVVLFDRHFFCDYYEMEAPDAPGASFLTRLHGWMLRRLYPRPDLVIYLDAPAEVLLARKGEGTLASLEADRQEYLRLRPHVGRFVVVDAAQPPDEVLRRVEAAVLEFHAERLGSVERPAAEARRAAE